VVEDKLVSNKVEVSNHAVLKNVEIQLEKSERKKYQKPKIKKSTPLSRKVALMKLKQSAMGNDSLPQSQRLYITVQMKTDSLQTKNVFIDNCWTVGRALDHFLTLFSVTNRNNSLPSSEQMKLYASTSPNEPLNFQAILKTIPNGETLFIF